MTTDASGRAHGNRSRYVWGPDENDTPGKPCRCRPCTDASTAAERHRERQILYGRWQPYVDAGPAREHARTLQAAGLGWRRVAQLAGVSTGAMSRLLHGGPGGRPPTRRLRPETAQKILAVRPGLDSLAPAALIDATGPHRRLQALVAIGHSQAALAARLSMTRPNFGTLMAQAQVTASKARAVIALYDELWDTPPDETGHRQKISASRARNYATARGWPPPLAWDDDQIDNPDAAPAEGWQRAARLSAEDVAGEVAEAVSLEGSRELAALRLGMNRSTLSTIAARTGRAS